MGNSTACYGLFRTILTINIAKIDVLLIILVICQVLQFSMIAQFAPL